MRNMKKKIGLTALGLTLALSLIGAVDGGVASASDVGSTSTTTVPPTAAPAPTTTEAPPTTEAPAPTTAEAPASRSAARGSAERRGPDPRWIDYGTCGRGYTACDVAKAHQRDGRFQWRHGRWFRWGSDRVRGTRGETWVNFRQEARQVRAYILALQVAQRRRALVGNWSGVAHCESGGNWAASGNGYYGGLQFNLGTWRAYGGTGMPNEQPAWYQATIAERIRVQSGLQHWPGCGAYYG